MSNTRFFQKGSPAHWAQHYTLRLGLALVPIPHGMKGPRATGWNEPQNAVTDPEHAIRVWTDDPGLNMGVLHSVAGTGALDVDHPEWAAQALAAIGIDLAELLTNPVRIRGKNGEKPLYTMPPDCQFERHALSWPHPTERVKDKHGNSIEKPVPVTVLELRAGALQDVLPPSIHPDTGKPYEWVGTPPRTRADIPELPEPLREVWENWEHYGALMRAACPWAAPEPPQKARQHTRRTQTSGGGELRPGDAFRERVGIREVLERNGYKPRGERYLPPGSKTKVAGVRILTGDDGVERAFSDHGSCALNDGHAHDSFSALILLEHGGSVLAAVKAAAAELGIERGGASGVMPLEQARELWEKHGSAVCTHGMALLTAAQGHHRVRGSLIDTWAALAEIAPDSLILRNGHFYIRLGGLQRFADLMGFKGRLVDISSRLKLLGVYGFFLDIEKLDPRDRYSELILRVTADPRDLPAIQLSQEESKRWHLNATSHDSARRARQKLGSPNTPLCTQRISRALQDTLCAYPPISEQAGLRLARGLAGRGALTVRELASVCGYKPETVRRYLHALSQEGYVIREGTRRWLLTVTLEEYRGALQVRREFDPAYRSRVLDGLRRMIRFAEVGIEASRRTGNSQLEQRRLRTLETARARLDRIEAGEPIREVLRRPA